MATTRTFRISGVAALVSLIALVLGSRVGHGLTALGTVLAVFSWPVFFVSALRHAFRRLLWRVGARLLISYLLIGVVPLPFLVGLSYLGVFLLTGQLAARRVESAFTARRAALAAQAEELAESLPDDAAARSQRLAESARELRAGWALATSGGVVEGGGPIAAKELLPSKVPPGPVIGRLASKRAFAGALADGDGGRVLLYFPIDVALEEAIEKETGVLVRFAGAHVGDEQNGKKGKPSGIEVTGDRGDLEIDTEADTDEDERPPPRPKPTASEGSGPVRGRWVTWGAELGQSVLDWPSGSAGGQHLVCMVRTSVSRELGELFQGSSIGSEKNAIDTGTIVVRIMGGLTAFALFVYLGAAALAMILGFRIARATRRLSVAFAELGQGRFGVRAELKGRDQLAELVSSFNRMSAHLAEAVTERAQRESIRHELEVARALQRRLLPPDSFRFPGIEIAADFRPAAEVGGDFYHFLAESDDRLVVAIADVSGHGLPTGIVMAAARSSLSALAAAGTPTPELFASLDREVRETTDARTFVTLSHARFRLADRAVELTNAGHLYPYRVTLAGEVSEVALPSRPLGLSLALPAMFKTATAPTAAFDLWVFLSDGILEALSPSGEEFGFARLEALLATCGGAAAEETKERILAAWRAHTGTDDPADDRTLLVLRIAA